MGRIEHRADDIYITAHEFNVLSGSCSGAVPSVGSINVNSNRCVDVFSCIWKKWNKGAFLIHSLVLPSVRWGWHVQSVGRESYVVKLNFIKTPGNKFLCDFNIVFPDFFTVWINPVFIIVVCFFSRYSSVFADNIFVTSDANPRAVGFVIPDGILSLSIGCKIFILEYNNSGNEISPVFLEFIYKALHINFVAGDFSLFLKELTFRFKTEKTIVILHVDYNCIELVVLYYFPVLCNSRVIPKLINGRIHSLFLVCGFTPWRKNYIRIKEPKFIEFNRSFKTANRFWNICRIYNWTCRVHEVFPWGKIFKFAYRTVAKGK